MADRTAWKNPRGGLRAGYGRSTRHCDSRNHGRIFPWRATNVSCIVTRIGFASGFLTPPASLTFMSEARREE